MLIRLYYMNPILPLILLGAVAGLAGAFTMNFLMRMIGAFYGRKVNMILVLGSFFTRKMENAHSLGTKIHASLGILFGIIYFLAFYLVKALTFPHAIFYGGSFGFFHGLIASYILMFYAMERHPVEEYRKGTLIEGFLHLTGHMVFGAVVGLIGALSGQILDFNP